MGRKPVLLASPSAWEVLVGLGRELGGWGSCSDYLDCQVVPRTLLRNKMKENKLLVVAVVVGGRVDIGAKCFRITT